MPKAVLILLSIKNEENSGSKFMYVISVLMEFSSTQENLLMSAFILVE